VEEEAAMPVCRFLLVVLLLVSGMGGAVAQDAAFDLAQTFADPAPTAMTQFGYAVAAVGSNVLVGAPFDDADGTDAGAAHLFDGRTGALIRTFRSPDPGAGDWFGIAVAAVGNTVAVGALGDDEGAGDAGAAYLFNAETGALIRKIQKPTVAEADWFGGSVAAAILPLQGGSEGAAILVGAPLDDTGAMDAGAAYLFEAATGRLMQAFPNPTPGVGDWFGVSLAVSRDRVLIGAMLDDTDGADAGAAYLFETGTGALRATLRSPAPAPGDWFGVGVAMDGDAIVVGAPNADVGAKDAGAAYLFTFPATGPQSRSVAHPAPAASDNFGRAVSVAGGIIAVGAPGAGKKGAVYLLPVSGTAAPITVRNPSDKEGDEFGFAVALLDARQLVVGAPKGDTAGDDAGSAYLLRAR
jgi:hypothetical protein